jgi:hypothetical protein
VNTRKMMRPKPRRRRINEQRSLGAVLMFFCWRSF